MTKFIYTFEDGKVTKDILETFPGEDFLPNSMAKGRDITVIKKGLLKYYEGVLEKPIVELEEKWFEIQSKIQNLDEKDNNNTEELLELTEERDVLEAGAGWLVVYRGIVTDITRPKVNPVIPEEDIKILVAYQRDKTVRNIEDSIADLAKMEALLMSFITAMYNASDDTMKSNIPDDVKPIIDYAVNKWPATQTRGDRQLLDEGTSLIDKLFDREVAIANIIDSLKQ